MLIPFSRIFIVSIFFAVNLIHAKNICSAGPQEGQPKKLCFFALNGPAESQALRDKKARLSCVQNSAGSISCQPKTTSTAEDEAQFEIEEFYAVTPDKKETPDKKGASVSKAFEEMTKTRCDGLVISGHHFGFYTGIKTKQEPDEYGDRVDEDVFLTLNFLEKLSCLNPKGESDCRGWFSNIKYLHLHGSYTAGGRVLSDGETLESVIIDEKMDKYSGGYDWPSFSVRSLMREYASTIDQSNPLSSRYLKMFPNANIFSYKNHAKTVSEGSAEEIMQSISDIGGAFDLASEGQTEDHFQKGLAQILQVLSSDLNKDICEKDKWKNNNIQLTLPSSTEEDEISRRLGCNFSDSLSSRDENKIAESLQEILDASEARPEILTQNLNRIFYALDPEETRENYKSRLPEKTRQKIMALLKTSQKFQENLETQMRNTSTGVVRRADFLHLYKKIFPESYNLKPDFEGALMTDILTLYGRNENPSVQLALSEIVWKNQLGSKSPGMVNALIGELGKGGDQFKQQIDLLRASANLESSIESLSETLDQFEGDTEIASWMQQWVDLKLKNGNLDLAASLYNSYTKDKTEDKKNALYSGIVSGLLQHRRRCSDGYPLKNQTLDFDNSKINEGLEKEWEKFCLKE